MSVAEVAWDGPVLLRSALSAAALGWQVFPCAPGGKRPALRGARLVAAARPGIRNDTLNRAAFSLGQLVAAGLLPPVPVITGLISAATRAGLSEKEAAGTVRSGMAGGARKPRTW